MLGRWTPPPSTWRTAGSGTCQLRFASPPLSPSRSFSSAVGPWICRLCTAVLCLVTQYVLIMTPKLDFATGGTLSAPGLQCRNNIATNNYCACSRATSVAAVQILLCMYIYRDTIRLGHRLCVSAAGLSRWRWTSFAWRRRRRPKPCCPPSNAADRSEAPTIVCCRSSALSLAACECCRVLWITFHVHSH